MEVPADSPPPDPLGEEVLDATIREQAAVIRKYHCYQSPTANRQSLEDIVKSSKDETASISSERKVRQVYKAVYARHLTFDDNGKLVPKDTTRESKLIQRERLPKILLDSLYWAMEEDEKLMSRESSGDKDGGGIYQTVTFASIGHVLDKIIEIRPKLGSKDTVVYDNGCGQNRFCIVAAAMKGWRGIGCEIDYYRSWVGAKTFLKLLRSKHLINPEVAFLQGDGGEPMSLVGVQVVFNWNVVFLYDADEGLANNIEVSLQDATMKEIVMVISKRHEDRIDMYRERFNVKHESDPIPMRYKGNASTSSVIVMVLASKKKGSKPKDLPKPEDLPLLLKRAAPFFDENRREQAYTVLHNVCNELMDRDSRKRRVPELRSVGNREHDNSELVKTWAKLGGDHPAEGVRHIVARMELQSALLHLARTEPPVLALYPAKLLKMRAVDVAVLGLAKGSILRGDPMRIDGDFKMPTPFVYNLPWEDLPMIAVDDPDKSGISNHLPPLHDHRLVALLHPCNFVMELIQCYKYPEPMGGPPSTAKSTWAYLVDNLPICQPGDRYESLKDIFMKSFDAAKRAFQKAKCRVSFYHWLLSHFADEPIPLYSSIYSKTQIEEFHAQKHAKLYQDKGFNENNTFRGKGVTIGYTSN